MRRSLKRYSPPPRLPPTVARDGRTRAKRSSACAESWKKRMAHTEFSVTQKARGFVSKVNPTTIPVSMDPYLGEVQAVLRVETDMEPDEAGHCIALGGKRYICVNGKDRKSTRLNSSH